MIYEYISLLLGILKLMIYKLLNVSRVNFKDIPKINYNFKIAIKKNSKLVLGKRFRARNNISFRVYDEGIITIGSDCFFNDGVSLNCQKKIVIGNNVLIGQNVIIFDHDHDYKNNINNFIKDDVIIGNNVWIGANSIILKGVSIGDNVVIAAGTIVKNNVDSNTILYQKRIDKNKVIK